jgi:hypothetical protein
MACPNRHTAFHADASLASIRAETCSASVEVDGEASVPLCSQSPELDSRLWRSEVRQNERLNGRAEGKIPVPEAGVASRGAAELPPRCLPREQPSSPLRKFRQKEEPKSRY